MTEGRDITMGTGVGATGTRTEEPGYAFETRRDGGKLVFSLSGRVSLGDADRLLAELESRLDNQPGGAVAVDLAGISYMDSAGVLTLFRLEEMMSGQGRTITYANVHPEIQRVMDLIDRRELAKPPLRGEEAPRGFVEAMGDAGYRVARDFTEMMTFVGDLVAALTHMLGHPRDVRWGDVLFSMRRAGSEGLPIVALISLLIGLIIAFMSSLQLKQFGANIYVASLVAVAIVRELGPIMTAILVAGRSASAYTAEIGSMMVNDEVDALLTMGYDPIRFLAVPKLIATVLVLPLLTLYADLFGIMGGMLVGVTGLDLTPYTYLQASRQTISVYYLVSSLVKAVVFAFIIAWIGCQRGFQVRGGVEEVGAATTSAVVTSILLIVIADSAFAIVLHYLD
jgi:phospholipid/cholesterol/gamma-HCH transport system permease protein